jgi:hypothetical protein
MKKEVEVNKTLAAAGDRPLPGSNIDDVINTLEAALSKVPANILKKALPTNLDIKVVLDELRWVANRFHVFEHGLIRIAQGTTIDELTQILDTRASVLYWLFDRDNEGPSNEEIIALCKQSNNPKFTDTITFRRPPGYKGGEPLKLMSAALDAIRIYERNYGPFIPQPEYLIALEQEDGGVRRFVNPDWVEWWTEYSDRIVHPLNEVENRLRESFKDRPHLTALDVRVKRNPEVHGIFNDDVERHEIIVSYQAFL